MQAGNMQPQPAGANGNPLAHNGSGTVHRNGRPISGTHAQHAGQPPQAQGNRNRSGTGGGNQFEGARSPPGAKSEFRSEAGRRRLTDKQAKDLSHVPCKFFRQGQCQAGAACPFSHDYDHSEQPCKYFSKGNCKFGPKCANLHVDQFGRVLNRREKNLGSYNLGGRADALAYQQQAAAMGIPPEQLMHGNQAFTHQLPPLSDLEGAVPVPQSQPYDIPGSQAQFGSPAEDGRFTMSPPMPRHMNDIGLPASFDSKGSSTLFKNGPIAASVPGKFFTGVSSPPSSMPRQSLLTSDAMRGAADSKQRPGLYGSSPGYVDDEQSTPRMLHSQQRHKPRGGGIMSTSLPVQEEWEKDDDGFFGDQEEYVPSELLNSQIRHKDDREDPNNTVSASMPRDFIRRDSFRSSGHGFGSPDVGTKWGSPSMASPNGSRFMGLFEEQKRAKDRQDQAAATLLGPVGSPRRASMFGTSPNFAASPPLTTGVSNLTAGLRDYHIGTEKPAKPTPAPVQRRLNSDSRIPTNRAISSNSVSQRIDEESQDFVFALDVDDLNVESKERMTSGPWGQPMSPSFGPVGAGRKSSMNDKQPENV